MGVSQSESRRWFQLVHISTYCLPLTADWNADLAADAGTSMRFPIMRLSGAAHWKSRCSLEESLLIRDANEGRLCVAGVQQVCQVTMGGGCLVLVAAWYL